MSSDELSCAESLKLEKKLRVHDDGNEEREYDVCEEHDETVQVDP